MPSGDHVPILRSICHGHIVFSQGFLSYSLLSCNNFAHVVLTFFWTSLFSWVILQRRKLQWWTVLCSLYPINSLGYLIKTGSLQHASMWNPPKCRDPLEWTCSHTDGFFRHCHWRNRPGIPPEASKQCVWGASTFVGCKPFLLIRIKSSRNS